MKKNKIGYRKSEYRVPSGLLKWKCIYYENDKFDYIYTEHNYFNDVTIFYV